MEDHADLLNSMLEKAKNLEKHFENFASASSGHTLVKLAKEDERKLQVAFWCVICKSIK